VILAAGLSPAWQQIVVLDGLNAGQVNRAQAVHWCASGKVLNVGLALHRLCASPLHRKGGPGGLLGARRESSAEPDTTAHCQSDVPRTLALIGGPPGDAIRREFANLGVSSRWVSSQTSTRVCTTILDDNTKTTTELVENAGSVSQDELEEFRNAYREEAAQADVVVLTGSLPAGTPATFYRDLLEKTPGQVVLDAQGEPLLATLDCRPFLVKPNREELGRTLGRSVGTTAELIAAMRELIRRGARSVVVSEGKQRILIASESITSITPPTVEVINPIGSGDCLAAGIAVTLAAGYDLLDAVAYGVAAGTENVRHILPARLDPHAVESLLADLRRDIVDVAT
jgi:1-phosphofructokinase family hexose kinase